MTDSTGRAKKCPQFEQCEQCGQQLTAHRMHYAGVPAYPRVRSIAKHHIFGLFRTSYRRKLQAFAHDRTVRTARTI